MYPNQLIPPLIMTDKKLTESAIKKKEKYFTMFLRNVLRNRHLRGCEHLYEFFTVKDSKVYRDKRKLREKQDKEPKSLFENITADGKANVGTSEHWKF